jgi:hypothetical protein
VASTRNFRHFLRYPEDVRALEAFGLERFLNFDLETAGLCGWRRRLFQRLAERTLRNGLQR